MHNFESPKCTTWNDNIPKFDPPPANTPWPFDNNPVEQEFDTDNARYRVKHRLPEHENIALKFDQHKARIELVDPLAIEGLAKVLEFGAKKYAVDNWRNGFNFTRIIGSLERHLNAIKRGEDTDPESGLPHIDHVGCNWMFLSFFMKERLDLDDRWYTKKKGTDAPDKE